MTRARAGHPPKAWPAATQRHRLAGGPSGADGIEPLAKSSGACPVHADAAVGAAVPSPSAEPVPVVNSHDRDDRHPERSAGRARPELSLPGSTRRRRELISELGMHAAELVRQAGARQDRPAVVTAATAKTTL
jgi:hypothetical protein